MNSPRWVMRLPRQAHAESDAGTTAHERWPNRGVR